VFAGSSVLVCDPNDIRSKARSVFVRCFSNRSPSLSMPSFNTSFIFSDPLEISAAPKAMSLLEFLNSEMVPTKEELEEIA